MAAGWGAFAGGLTRGYLAGEDLRETRKRTALMGEEVEMRKQDAARRADEAAWQKRQRDNETAYRKEMAAYDPQYVPDENGNVDPANPLNAKANARMYAKSYEVRRKYELTSPREDAEHLKWQGELADKEKDNLVAKFAETGDVKWLEQADPDFKGVKLGVGKGPAGEAMEVLVFPDGRIQPTTMLYARTAGGKVVLEQREKAIDNARQDARDKATIEHQRRVEARLGAAASSAEQSAKAETLIRITNEVEKRVLKAPVKNQLDGTTTDPDPPYNKAASALADKLVNEFDTTKRGAVERAAAIGKISSEVKDRLGKLDAAILRRAGGDKAIAEKNRPQVYQWFMENDFQIPPEAEVKGAKKIVAKQGPVERPSVSIAK
jgi:hypothetical protein